MTTKTATIEVCPAIGRTPAMVRMHHYGRIEGFYNVRSDADEKSAVDALILKAKRSGFTHVKLNGKREAI